MRHSVATLALACSFVVFSVSAFAANTTLNANDQKFMTKAAQGGMAEVSLGNMAQKKAQSADVKNFGKRMVTDHTKVNQQLEGLAKQKNLTLPTKMDSKHMATEKRLSNLKGATFDREYMKHMVTDHEKDVADFQKAAKTAKDPDVKKFASDTLPALQEHLKLARELKAKVK